MKVAAHNYFGWLAIAVMMASRTSVRQKDVATLNQPESAPAEENEHQVYVELGPDAIRVIISGPKAENPGSYYLKPGSTLESALTISDNLKNRGSGHLVWDCKLEQGSKAKKEYDLRHLIEAKKEEVLHDGDCLYFLNNPL
jgi:hypothetical protein